MIGLSGFSSSFFKIYYLPAVPLHVPTCFKNME